MEKIENEEKETIYKVYWTKADPDNDENAKDFKFSDVHEKIIGRHY